MNVKKEGGIVSTKFPLFGNFTENLKEREREEKSC